MRCRHWGPVGSWILLAGLVGACSTQHPGLPMRFAPAVPATVALDSMQLARFRSLPPAQRAESRKLAEEYVRRAARTENAMRRFTDRSRLWDEADESQPEDLGSSLVNCLQDFEGATRQDPTCVEAWYKKAEITATLGDWGSARRYLESARAVLGRQSDKDRAHYRTAIALLGAWLDRDEGLWQAGLDQVAIAEAEDPRNQEIQLVKGLLLAGAGRFSEACQIAVALGPVEYPFIVYGMHGLSKSRSIFASRWIQAMAYLADRQPDMAYYALGPLDPYRIQFPYMTRYWNDVGLICEQAGRQQESRLYYALAYVTVPDRLFFPSYGYSCAPLILDRPHLKTPCWVSFGQYYLAGSLFTYAAQATAEFFSASDSGKRTLLAHNARNYLEACMRRGDYPELARALRGRLWFALGDYERAEEDLTAANLAFELQQHHDPMTSFLLGTLRLRRDQFAAAVPYLHRAVEADSTLAAGWRSLGVALIRIGDLTAGRAALDRALELQPRSVVGRFNRGLLNFQDGRFEDAILDLAVARNLAPDNKDVVELLARAQYEWDKAALEQGEVGLRAGEPVAPTPDEAFTDETPAQLPELTWAGNPAIVIVESADPDLDAAAAAALLSQLEAAYEQQPSPENRTRLARAYIHAGQPGAALRILLPHWPGDLTNAELRLVIEADRALGYTERARAVIKAALEGTPLVADPVYWSLLAFTLIDNGYTREGFQALDVAIDLEESAVSDETFMDSSSGSAVGVESAKRLSALRSFRETFGNEIQMRRQQGGQGSTGSEALDKTTR